MDMKTGPLLLAVCLWVHTGWSAAADPVTLTPILQAQATPDFALAVMDGGQYRLSDQQGKPVIINFWATWCPPCRRELPSMNQGWQKIKHQGIDMVAINVGEDEDTIFPFTADFPIEFPVLLDLNGEITAQWPIKGLPTTFVIDPDGRIVYRAIGGRDWGSDIILDKVRALRR